MLVITADSHQAHELEHDLTLLRNPGDPEVVHFPDWETLPYDLFSPHPDIVSQRLAVLSRLPQMRRCLIVVPVSTLMQRVAPRGFLMAHGFALKLGDKLDLGTASEQLEDVGYRRVPQVYEPGEYAVRGSLLDLFPMASTTPCRIELFDDEIETIRFFDPESQRSQEKTEQIDLMPAHEFPFNESANRGFRRRFRERFDVDIRNCSLYQDMRINQLPSGIEYYQPLFFDAVETLFDYLTGAPLVIHTGNTPKASKRFWEETCERNEQRRYNIERPVLDSEELFLSPTELETRYAGYAQVFTTPGNKVPVVKFATRPPPVLPIHQKGETPAGALKQFIARFQGKLLISADSPGRRETLSESLAELGIQARTVESWQEFLSQQYTLSICALPLSDGTLIAEPAIGILTETQLYGERVQQLRRRKPSGRDPEAIIRDLTDLHPGTPVVHEDHGVGRYLGLQKLAVGENEAEYLALEYAGEAKLYVPVAALHLINRYTGRDPELAPLHKLGGDQWRRIRRKAAEKVRDVAAELLELYARREARKGRQIALDRALYEDFAATFPFEETIDQEQSISAVLSDLALPRPMDRVVCGDVGFGKTEVALRAAFAVASAGRQAALLVPTTLLAQQHYQTFSDRFADWPIRVEVLSRFRSAKESRSILEQMDKGQVDVLIGTHRLLQKDIKFHNLGLIIIDEEQRFGVRQKERLKAMRAEVDLLTLTATPIPRTLNMSMSGLRDLSIIATPPRHRMAVKTLVCEWEDAMLREAIQREVQRGGQVYFLHNRVEDIERIARHVQELAPNARLRIAHGQMRERELEQVMLDFYRQRFNVLVCTTIIESGIDVPTANTIIINRADRFGLAQLHQLRGRVGRSHHRAYAYLLTPDRKSITRDAAKRLEAIESLEELGSGFTLATHDLEIRGAGELLGEEQSGQIQEIGFSMYTELLERAVEAFREGKIPDLDHTGSRQCEVELHIPALIPDDYLPDVHTRLTLYKRIAGTKNEEDLRALQVEMIDRFGLLPEPAKNLFAVARVKQRATALGILRMEAGPEGGRILFSEETPVEPKTVIALIQQRSEEFSLDGQDRLRFTMNLESAQQRIQAAERILSHLCSHSEQS